LPEAGDTPNVVEFPEQILLSGPAFAAGVGLILTETVLLFAEF